MRLKEMWYVITCFFGHHRPGIELGPDKEGRRTAYCRGCGVHLTMMGEWDEY